MIATTLLAIIATYCVLHWPAMQTEVAAAWAQGVITALGIGAALLGTLWIAKKEDRRRHGADMVRARLHAVALTSRLRFAKSVVWAGRDKMFEAMVGHLSTDQIATLMGRIEKISLWSAEELLPITPLAPYTIGLLGVASGEIQATYLALQHVPLDDSSEARENRQLLAKKLYALFSRNLDRIDAGIDLCQLALVKLESSKRAES